MEWVETTGRSLEQAKAAALEQLGVAESDAEFVVLEEPRPGLFGRWRGEARVRARVRPTRPRPKRDQERRNRRHRVERERSGRNGQAPVSGGAGAHDGAEGQEGAGVGNEATTPDSTASHAGGAGRRRNRRRRSRGARVTEPRAEEAGASLLTDNSENRSTNGVGPSAEVRQEGGTVAEVTGQEQVEMAVGFLRGLLRELAIEATVQGRYEEERGVVVEVEGQGLGPLVGPGGATMAALQEVARAYLQRRTQGRSERLVLDVAGYRARRVAALERFTQKVAEEVLQTGEPRALEPMSAADRKVVHDTVHAIPGVTTRSEGEEPRRFTVIVPEEPAEPAS